MLNLSREMVLGQLSLRNDILRMVMIDDTGWNSGARPLDRPARDFNFIGEIWKARISSSAQIDGRSWFNHDLLGWCVRCSPTLMENYGDPARPRSHLVTAVSYRASDGLMLGATEYNHESGDIWGWPPENDRAVVGYGEPILASVFDRPFLNGFTAGHSGVPNWTQRMFLNGQISWLTKNYKVYLLTSGYTFNFGHRHLDDVPVAARIASSAALSGRSVNNVGQCFADDFQVGSVPEGKTITQYALYEDTGDPATSPLLRIGKMRTPSTITVGPDPVYFSWLGRAAFGFYPFEG